MHIRTALTLIWLGPLWLWQTTGPVDDSPGPTASPQSTGSEEKGTSDPDGLWPSGKLMRSVLTRMADDLSDRYELDDNQRQKVREGTVRRWDEFLSKNRDTMQPLVNEFLEMRLDPEPPVAEKVQKWAERALPVLEKGREEIRGNWGDLREVFTPMQRAKFEIDALATSAGLEIAEHKLKAWRDGEFELEEVWEPRDVESREERRDERRRRREERRERLESERQAAAKTNPADQIEIELQAWDKYVEEFILAHSLDGGQKTAVRSCLNELKERARGHRDRRREEITTLERQIEERTDDEKQLEEIKKKLVELYGPIDDMFSELKRRMEPVLTEEQRQRALSVAPQLPPSSEDEASKVAKP